MLWNAESAQVFEAHFQSFTPWFFAFCYSRKKSMYFTSTVVTHKSSCLPPAAHPINGDAGLWGTHKTNNDNTRNPFLRPSFSKPGFVVSCLVAVLSVSGSRVWGYWSRPHATVGLFANWDEKLISLSPSPAESLWPMTYLKALWPSRACGTNRI